MILRAALSVLFTAAVLSSQIPDNGSLTGKYYVRHLQLSAEVSTTISSIRSFSGTLTFDGNGGLTWQGQQTTGTAAPASLGGSGTYSVQGNGFVTLSNPQQSGATVNARMGTNAIVGSTTDGATNTYDFLVAIPAPAGGATNGSLNGTYFVSSLDFLGATSGQVRNAFFRVTSNGSGNFGDVSITGQGANLGSQTVTQLVSGATYNLTADGSGSAVFPIPSSGTANGQLVGGRKVLYISKDGSLFLAGSSENGGQDMIIGVKSIAAGASNSNLKGLYFTAGLRFESEFNAHAGASSATGEGKLVSSRRVRTSSGPLDLTALNAYTVNADGSGIGPELNTFGIGVGGQAFVGGGVANIATGVYEIYLGIRAPSITGSTNVFLNPQGVVNAASFAPTGAPIAPGEFITLFGSGFSSATTVAQSLPFPATLGGVQVLINNQPAPVYLVSPNQLSVLVPFSTTGSTASILVNNNGSRSNTVTVPLAQTSPGIFTVPPAGFGPGAILHADFSLVSAAKPARTGETILVFLTGLGAVSPSVPDGAAGPSGPLSNVVASMNVYIGGVQAPVSFKGLAPGFAGLYQMNVVVPAGAPAGSNVSLAIATPNAFHDQVDVAVQ
jgi:IPT/TIG domain.